MGLYPPGSMTSTHSGSPFPVAAAMASLEIIQKENLAERAARMGEILIPELAAYSAEASAGAGMPPGKRSGGGNPSGETRTEDS